MILKNYTMKKLIFLILLMPIFAHAQLPQNDRWKLLYEDTIAKTKTYVDSQTITFNDYFEIKKKVYLIWIRTYHDFSDGKYSQYDNMHIAISMSSSQYELKSLVKFNNGNVTDSQQFDNFNWLDIVPESNAELVLNYCKKLNN